MLPPSWSLLRLAAYLVPFMAIGVLYWLHATFGDVTVDQALWHLQYAEGAAIRISEIFYVECAVYGFVLPLVAALVVSLAHLAIAPYLGGWPRKLLRAGPAAAGFAAVGLFCAQFSVVSYAAAYLEPDRFAQEYVDPSRVQLVPERRRNLVLIYAESMEASYGDAHMFGRDLLAPLHALGGRSYGWYRPAVGATWTMAGMVATQCGVPLKVYSEVDVRPRGEDRVFLPGAHCLGDVLQARGYRNVFMGGVSLSFAGKGRFLKDHGYQETWGRDEWEAKGARPEEFNAWGMWDGNLFQRAKERLDQLHASGQPFNLTLLTLNTHNPFGFLSPRCRARGVDTFEGIVGCSAERIAEFISYARERGYLEDTVVVVIGDHLAVPNPVYDRLVQAPRRGMFNLFLGKDLPPPNRDELLPFDLFPTLVELTGARVTGDRLALGYSAVGHAEADPPPDRAEAWAQSAMRPSSRYDLLWDARASDD
ncbi:sulfatase-like hydrolase/transferase [Ramlibacter sp. USB13]|uniref:Sulfatase-like hydrolase/transferase n=1 Tax=Ramlibacter cellulosilyticus TaxID=2764187 RepID=A0A923SAI6_9BURK|nr:sulfatase-like hydrolase/transferase [Ramlibacter cellulosilyticus]MBC5782814.1 sulfatase-like hydrolase/transferase [Ramlibacter cellulosilyticus]